MPCQADFKWKKGDVAAAALVVAMAALILLIFVLNGYGKKAGKAEIWLKGELVREVDLSEDQEFVLQSDYENCITVRDGKISVSGSDCPGEDCVHSGWKSHAGESIVCLPNQLEIRIQGESDVDFVTGY